MIDGVLLVAFGGPRRSDEIRPFLENVARGRRIPPERLELVARQYREMPGARSPLPELTFAQAQALAQALADAGRSLGVDVGMRNWHPYLHETLSGMAARGVRRALAIILSPFRTEASWDRYVEDVAAARARVAADLAESTVDAPVGRKDPTERRADAPEGRKDPPVGCAGSPERWKDPPVVVFAPPWSTRPHFLDAVAERAREALVEIPAELRARTPLVFTAHSVPVAMAESSPYVMEFTAAARAVAGRLDHPRWSLAYQSRSGRPDDPWLEPDIEDVLRSLAADGEKHVVVVPIGFVVDHVEVLYDLDVKARRTAASLGISLHRAPSVNTHPGFIKTLAELVLEAAERNGIARE